MHRQEDIFALLDLSRKMSLIFQKLHFQPVDSPDIQKDLAALRGGIRNARQVVQLPHIAEHILQEVNPGSDVQTEEELNEYIFEHIFGEQVLTFIFFWLITRSASRMLHQ
jgi:hypothetical protein